MLQFMAVTRVGQDLVTDQQQLPKCPLSNTIILGIRVSTYEFGVRGSTIKSITQELGDITLNL